MKVTDLEVDGFGVWSGLQLAELSDQVNVFYGPNEAGKTTLLQFVRSILFGFSPERRARYFPPLRAGRPGGAIRAVVGERRYTISRHADEPGEVGDVVVTSDGRQSVHGDATLSALLGAIDEPAFNNIFAFGLREIQELGTLSETQAAGELYDLTLGVDRVSLADVLRELEVSRDRLLAADDRPSLVAQLLSQRERLQAEIDDLGQSTARYLALSFERQKLETEIGRLEAENSRCEQKARELAMARAVAEQWKRRTSIDRQMGTLTGFEALPEQALARFDRLESRLASRRRRYRQINQQRRALTAQIEQLNINEALRRQSPRIEALGEQQEWIASLASQIDALETEVLDLEARHEESVKQWGRGAEPPAGSPEPFSKNSLSELRAAAKALRQARRDLRAYRERIVAAEKSADQHQRQLDTTLGNGRDGGLTKALADAGELVSQLRKRVQLDERLDQMSRRQKEFDEENGDQLERQILPTWALASLGVLFVLGCALVLLYLAGLILPASLSGALGWPVGLVGLGAAGVAAVIKIGMERFSALQLDACQQQTQQLAQQIKQATTEREELDARLPRAGGPLVTRLQSAEKELARLEELLPLESQRETARRQADTAREQEEALQGVYRQQQKKWRLMLHQNGMPANLTPHDLPEFVRRREHLRGLSKDLVEKQQQLDRRRAEYDTLGRRVTHLIAEVGITPRSERPLDQLRQCLTEFKEQQSRLVRREELAQQIDTLRRRQAKIKRTADKLRERRQSLLRTAGTTDPQEFRRRAQLQAEAGRLQAERAQLAHEIAATVGDQTSEQRLAELMASQEGLEPLEVQLTELRQATASHLNEAREKRGAMNQQLKTLLEDRQLVYKRIELGTVEKRLQDALDRWRVLTVCGMMLEAVRQYYEREHQPQALREASTYLQQLTGGRYRRVWTPLGAHVLRVDDRDGQSLDVELLSSGTREQLFLALRLALLSAYARRGVHVPLVLDDVLVNFDVGRAKAAAVLLRDFARHGHQILVFTCHEHIAKLFKQIKAEVRQLPDNANPQGDIETDPAAKPVRRSRPEPVPEPVLREEPELTPSFEESESAEPVAEEVEPPEEPRPVVVSAPAAEEPVAPLAKPAPQPARSIDAPPPRPIRRPPPRAERHTERVKWSAEEFDGELSDRVRRALPEDARGSTRDIEKHDDAEAA